MIRNILKKDLQRKKTMNLVLLIFIILATVFLSSSVNNLLTTVQAFDYFGRRVNVSDYFIVSLTGQDIETWAEQNENITGLTKEDMIVVNNSEISKNGEELEISQSVVLTTIPQERNLVLDQDDSELSGIAPGEIGISYGHAAASGLKLGDRVQVRLGQAEKTLTVSHIMKDIVFGSTYMGLARMMINEDDFTAFAKTKEIQYEFYSVDCKDSEVLLRDINEQRFATLIHFDRATLTYTYMLDMMVFAVLIIVGICLIAIAFVVLRFTIVFTLQEDYQEIGIMKAIGLRDQAIRSIYLIKYLFMAVAGAVFGVAASFPFGELFIGTLRKQIAMEPSGSSLAIRLLCGALVILLVIIFCYFSTAKVNRYTAVQAIRSGSSGERFRPKGALKLHRQKRLPVPLYLAVNDIVSGVRSYLVLLVVFVLGTLLIILPVNTVNTLQSDNVVELFGLLNTDMYIDNGQFSNYLGNGNQVKADLDQLARECRRLGLDVELHAEKSFMSSVFVENEDEKRQINGIQAVGSGTEHYQYLEGAAPVLANELAMTERVMDSLGVEVGDYVYVQIADYPEKYLITAKYQALMNQGTQLRMAGSAVIPSAQNTGLYTMQGQFVSRTDVAGQMERLRSAFPTYEIRTAREYSDTMLGSIRPTLESVKALILLVVAAINALVSVLMCKSFFSRDLGNIALLKSIGFASGDIRLWQILRIAIVMIAALILGVVLSGFLNGFVGRISFGMMGAPHIQMEINALQIYLLYPLFLLAVTIAAVTISTAGIKRVGLTELGNLE